VPIFEFDPLSQTRPFLTDTAPTLLLRHVCAFSTDGSLAGNGTSNVYHEGLRATSGTTQRRNKGDDEGVTGRTERLG